MELKMRHAVAAAVIGFLAVGGVSIAQAQTDDGSTTTTQEDPTTTVPEDDATTPEDDTGAGDRPGCDRDGNGTADNDGGTETTDPSAEASSL